MANNLQSQWYGLVDLDPTMGAEPSYSGDYFGLVDLDPTMGAEVDDTGYSDSFYTNTGYRPENEEDGPPIGTVDDQYAIEENLPWQESVRKFLGIGETGAKFFKGMAGGTPKPRTPPRTPRASSRGRDARTDPISRAREARSRQVASLRRPPVEVDFDKLFNRNVLAKFQDALEDSKFSSTGTGTRGTKTALSSAGLGAIRSTKKLT